MQKAFITVVGLVAVFVLGTSAFSTGLKGDFDKDGDVDAKDLAVFSANYGKNNGTCTDNDNCIPGYYCEKEIGDCKGAGVCTEKPTGCVEIYDSVCGCDGNTYGNACAAAAAGVNVDYLGECRQKYCFGNNMCGADEYCLFEPCAVETGVCVLRPEICPDVWDPVCGCDNRTYSNACAAAANGMSVAHRGACQPDGCCVDLCGDGECAQIVCLACGCPCAENPDSCPLDCLPN